MIPKRLHLVWSDKEGKTILSNLWTKNKELISHFKNTGWQIFIWLENKNSVVVENNLGKIYEIGDTSIINIFSLPVQKSDAIRLLAVYKLGGVYIDWDFDFVKPIDDLLNCHSFVGREDNKKICNAIFGAEQSSPFIESQINRLHEMPTDKRVWGVNLMTETVLENPNYAVTIYPQEYFYPYSWHEQDETKKLPKKNTYLIHRWEKSWWEKK